MDIFSFRRKCLVAVLSFSGFASLAGCGAGVTSAPITQALKINGTVHGGALPINGSHIYLYAANTQGMGGPEIAVSASNISTSLLTSGANTTKDSAGHYYVTGGATGQFSLTGDFAACTAGQELYLYSTGGNARGGDPTKTGGINGVNAAIGLLSDLGECSTIGADSNVVINEMSTVGAAYALAGYASDATHIGDDEGLNANTTAALAKTGMANAFANASNLVTLSGTALTTTPAGNGTVPTATVNTIANILAGCVQSSGPTSRPCSDLFSFTATATSSDTATAAINLAHNPDGVQTSTTGSSGGTTTITAAQLFSDIEPNTDFVPNLNKAPFDYSVAILYAGNGITTPVGLAVDANGSVWVADSGSNSVLVLSGQGASYGATQDLGGGLATPTEIAIDANGAAWATNPTSVTQISGSGATYTATEHDGGINGPTDIAIDISNDVWVTSNTGGASVFLPLKPGVYSQQTENALGGDYKGVAVDASNYVWITSSNGSFERILLNGSSKSISNGQVPGTPALLRVVIDNMGRAWIEDGGTTFTIVTPSGPNLTQSTSGADTHIPSGFILDVLNDPWAVCNLSIGSTVCHLDTGGSGQLVTVQGTTGDGSSGSVVTGTTNRLAFDGSGNLWVSNSNNVAEFVGAGTPVVTPLVGAVIQNKIATRP